MKHLRFIIPFAFAFFFTGWIQAQTKVTISGTIKDAKNGEVMTGASVVVKEIPDMGAITNAYGFYSLTLPVGKYTLVFRYIGYNDIYLSTDSIKDKTVNIKLAPSSVELKDVEISARKNDENIRNTEVGVTHLDLKTLSKLPVLFGEKDILKTIQLLPGVLSGGEGNSGFYVRGGSADQNLILLDEAPVYNPGHLLGFFSVFNNDALKDATLYKGNMPAEYGGRLSSVLDVKMKEGNDKDYVISGGIGIIASRLLIEGPIQEDKGSFIITGRRTYADLFLKLSNNASTRSSRLYFYDINTKANYRLGKRDHIFLSGYFGQDVLGLGSTFGINYGNITGTLRLNHIFSDKLFSNTSLIFNDYNYKIAIANSGFNVNVTSIIRDYSLKEDFDYYLDSKNKLKFGFLTTVHTIVPGVVSSADSSIKSFALSRNFGWENAVYAQHEISLWNKVNINYGVRLSTFTVTGPGNFYSFNNSGTTDTSHLNLGRFGRTYFNPEPRFSLSYNFVKDMSFKVAYSRNTQNVHLLTNATTSNPTDRWLLTTNNVRPEISDQVSAGYYANFLNNMFEISVEGYFKTMQNQIDYKNGAQLLGNETVESQLLYGKGRAYGAEFFFKKTRGKFTGWVSYTLSRSERQFTAIDNGNWFLSPFDRTHDLSIVAMYDITPKINVSAVWVYYTGQAATFPVGKYPLAGQIIPYYGNRNADRFPAYHRLDLSATFTLKSHKYWTHDINLSIYNLYARKNAYSIAFISQNNVSVAQETYLFTIIPSISYNFKFVVPKKKR